MFHKVSDTYGIELQSSAPLSQLDFELAAFKLCREGHTDGLLGSVEHFSRAATILWPLSCPKPFVVTQGVREMVQAFCENVVVTVTGHGSSEKTATASTFALVSVFAEPGDVMCICVSTDIEGASTSRIYGQIKDFFGAIQGKMSFKLNESRKSLSPYDPFKIIRFPSSAGIKLVSGNANKEKEAEGKIKGYKMGAIEQGRIILIADEGCDIADGIYKTFFSNLRGNPKAQLIALANLRPNNFFYDLCTPVGGWPTVQAEDQQWETEAGVCIHRDGLQAPNWRYHLAHPEEKDDLYSFMQSWTLIEDFYRRGAEDSADFWEQVRAFPPPIGTGDPGIYDAAEIAMYKGDRPVLEREWADHPVAFSGTDPAFSEDGDRAVHYPGRCGFLLDGTFAIEWLEPIEIPIKAGEGNKAAAYQIVEFMCDWQSRWNVDATLMGYDSTDENFKAIVKANGGRDFFPVPFHGSATDRVVMVPLGKTVAVKNSDWYANRVSEIWGIGREFLRASQLRGIRGMFKTEATIRRWKETDSINKGRRLKCVESKREMKKRMKRRSPDFSDAAFIGLDTLICQFRLKVGQGPWTRKDADELRRKLLAQGRITPRHLGRHNQSGSFVQGMFNTAVKRIPVTDMKTLKFL